MFCGEAVIITGASDGLGKSLAELCIAENIKVINLSRSPSDVKGIVNIACDLTNEIDIIKAVNKIKSNHNNFSALINCAGAISVQEPNKVTYKELQQVMQVNSLAPIFLTSQLFDLIVENNADILNVGSTVGTKAYKDQAAYVTSKWAIRGTSLYWQLELAKSKCRVIQFNVGGMETRFWEKYNNSKVDDPKDWMDTKDIAKLILDILRLPKQVEISEITINRKGKRE